MPASSSTARIGPPAITPVPGAAGFMKTRPAPTCRVTSCGIVRSTIGTVIIAFFACSTPLRIASGTSPALPMAKPTLALAIADDDERAEAEALTALDDLRHAIDANDRLFDARIVAIATATIVH